MREVGGIMDFIKSTLYLREYFYTSLDGNNIEFRAVSYKQLDMLQTKYALKHHQLTITIIKQALINKEDFIYLSSGDIDELYALIIKVSTLSIEDLEDITTAVTITLADTFKDETFKSCALCKERGLDKHRNCPFLSEITHDPGVFYIVDNKKLTKCPMDKTNSGFVNDAFKAYNLYENGFLPEAGGMYDQSLFFVEVSGLVQGLINKHQADALDNH